MTLQKIICKVILPKCAEITKMDVKIGVKEKCSSIFVIKLLFFVAFTSQRVRTKLPAQVEFAFGAYKKNFKR